MEVRHAIGKGLDVHRARLKCVVDGTGHLGHLFEVEGSDDGFEVEHLLDALLGDEERSSPKVLVRPEAHVAGLEASNQPGIAALVR